MTRPRARILPGLDATVRSLDGIQTHPENYNNGDVDEIEASMVRHGVFRPIIVQASTGYVIDGNHTYLAMREQGLTEGPVITHDVDDDTARSMMIAANRIAQRARSDDGLLLAMLDRLDDYRGTGWDEDDIASLRARTNEGLHGMERDAEVAAGKKMAGKRRDLPLDLIFSCGGTSAEAHLGYRLGWKQGVISSAAATARAFFNRYPKAPGLTFMDNEWQDYDHKRHVDAVAEFHPTYATTRDLLTREQAEAAGVVWHSLDDTLAMAEDVARHTDNVILIPKYACIPDIPERIGGARVVLGYSVESSYGGTPLPIAQFRGRPIHLLGGPWKKQRAYLNLMGDDVVSLDNNNVLKVSTFGSVVDRNGDHLLINDLLGHALHRGYLPTLALSLANIATEVMDTYGVDVTPVDIEEPNPHD
jgi:hypothetical protein